MRIYSVPIPFLLVGVTVMDNVSFDLNICVCHFPTIIVVLISLIKLC